jgi:hypothetical protein
MAQEASNILGQATIRQARIHFIGEFIHGNKQGAVPSVNCLKAQDYG